MGGCLSKGEKRETEPKPGDQEENAPKTEEGSAENPTGGEGTAAAKQEDDGGKVENGVATTDETPATDTAVKETPEQPTDREDLPVVFVLGASGTVGSATIKVLSEEYADKVQIRAGVRNPDSADKLKSLSGVTLVQANMADKDSLVPALSGVLSLYIVTPGTENRVDLAVSAAEAAKEAEVQHVVVVSGPMCGLDDTLFGRHWSSIENSVSGLGIPYTILRLHYFMDNYLATASSIKANSTFTLPIPGDKPYTVIAPSDIGWASAEVLSQPSRHEGKIYNIISDRVTNDGIAAALSTVLEKEIGFVCTGMEEAKAVYEKLGLQEWAITGIMDMARLIAEGHPTVNPEDIGDFKEITGKDPISMKDYLSSHGAMFK